MTTLTLPDAVNREFTSTVSNGVEGMSHRDREEWIATLFQRQLAANKRLVPFYTRLYRHVDVDEVRSFEDCVTHVPAVTKEQIRGLESPYDLLSEPMRERLDQIYLHRGTGGTTGEPTHMFYSYADWRAILDGMTRNLGELSRLARIVAFNGYNQGHISGPIFDDTIRNLEGLSIARNFGCDDEQAVRQMKAHGCNLLIAPPTSTHKGGSIEDLLAADAKLGLDYINGDNVDAVFCSSTSLTPALHDELKELGISYIYNFYGSTDALPTAISCQENPFDMHILFGHIALFVVDSEQRHVESGRRGMALASRIGSLDRNGEYAENEATQLLNFHVGDEVTYIESPCPCGRRTPRIRDVRRVLHTDDKDASGCQRW